ncbi:uncharacterized protein EHS24_007978 [Apiotrichum porosum]|uniref:Uncharacterized protein n=1 Tax=Apiotrichum porosum TaxID=105984 RepID=A0A427XSF3_9TREE|nr:uncharacterized protein EHS24_007978 [Apiotrichum porosum]RSH81786.1 hypothetical protein EHS24_007978 [Apiotrichum porosum]
MLVGIHAVAHSDLTSSTVTSKPALETVITAFCVCQLTQRLGRANVFETNAAEETRKETHVVCLRHEDLRGLALRHPLQPTGASAPFGCVPAIVGKEWARRQRGSEDGFVCVGLTGLKHLHSGGRTDIASGKSRLRVVLRREIERPPSSHSSFLLPLHLLVTHTFTPHAKMSFASRYMPILFGIGVGELTPFGHSKLTSAGAFSGMYIWDEPLQQVTGRMPPPGEEAAEEAKAKAEASKTAVAAPAAPSAPAGSAVAQA